MATPDELLDTNCLSLAGPRHIRDLIGSMRSLGRLSVRVQESFGGIGGGLASRDRLALIEARRAVADFLTLIARPP